jgi:hypothetical protein
MEKKPSPVFFTHQLVGHLDPHLHVAEVHQLLGLEDALQGHDVGLVGAGGEAEEAEGEGGGDSHGDQAWVHTPMHARW